MHMDKKVSGKRDAVKGRNGGRRILVKGKREGNDDVKGGRRNGGRIILECATRH